MMDVFAGLLAFAVYVAVLSGCGRVNVATAFTAYTDAMKYVFVYLWFLRIRGSGIGVLSATQQSNASTLK